MSDNLIHTLFIENPRACDQNNKNFQVFEMWGLSNITYAQENHEGAIEV